MRVPRLFLEQTLALGEELALNDTAAHHVRTVLRSAAGDPLELFNGEVCVRAEISHLDRKRVTVRLLQAIDTLPRSPLRLRLVQGLARADRMDWVMQKATELGVHEIQPVMMRRSQPRFDAKREAKKMSHWYQVIVHAAQQCGRTEVPVLADFCTLEQWLDRVRGEAGMSLYCEPAANLRLTQLELASDQAVNLIIGPEGGFSAEERELLQRFGVRGVWLGPRILRTETAALSTLTMLQACYGDWV